MVVGDEFGDSSSMMAFTQRDQTVQTFLFDRADEPFGVSVGVSRRLHRRHAMRLERFGSRTHSIRCAVAPSS
jgi:hypothetical protein